MTNRRKGRAERSPDLSLRTPWGDQLLIDALSTWFDDPRRTAEGKPVAQGWRALCTTHGYGQLAGALAERVEVSHVTCHFLDLYLAEQGASFCGDYFESPQWASGQGDDSAARLLPRCDAVDTHDEALRLRVDCLADFDAGPFELAAIPVSPRGEAELTRELLQQAYERLVTGGWLWASTTNAKDQWLHEELRRFGNKVTVRLEEEGAVYSLCKQLPLKKQKTFDCEFAFRFREQLLKAMSRPGVFSHRSLDAGARALMNTMAIPEGGRVVDIGCGSGVVSFAAAASDPTVHVLALDSNPRAIACTRAGALANGFSERIETRLTATGETAADGSFDIAVANPPYYGDHRLSELFVDTSLRALRPGGTMYLVTKAPKWYEEYLPDHFETFTRHDHRAYYVFEAMKPQRLPSKQKQ